MGLVIVDSIKFFVVDQCGVILCDYIKVVFDVVDVLIWMIESFEDEKVLLVDLEIVVLQVIVQWCYIFIFKEQVGVIVFLLVLSYFVVVE